MTNHPVCNWINTTGATSGEGTAYPFRPPSSPNLPHPVFNGVRVT